MCLEHGSTPCDPDERETDGARHWDGEPSELKGKFRNQVEKEFTDEEWLHCVYLGNIKTRFGICKDEHGELRYVRAIQGHSGGMIISPRLMNYVMVPYTWKRFVYHVGRSRDQCSIAQASAIEPSMTRRDRQSTEKEESIRHVSDREAGVEGGAATLRTHNRDRASV